MIKLSFTETAQNKLNQTGSPPAKLLEFKRSRKQALSVPEENNERVS